MRITVNGDEREVAEGAGVADLLPGDLTGTAVAVNGEVVPRLDLGAITLAEGYRVEIVTAVQGG